MRVAAAPAFANETANPYNSLLYSALRRAGVEVTEFARADVLRRPPDVVHLHWPESALNKPRRAAAMARTVELLLVLFALRLRGTRIIWTAHNIVSHGRRYPWVESGFWALFVRLLSGWISLSERARDLATERHPRLRHVPNVVVPHGHYRGAYPAPPPRDVARTALGLPLHVPLIAFVGRVKPYKGVPTLLSAFAAMPDTGLRLVVAGRCDDPALARTLRDAAEVDPRVQLRLQSLTPEDIAELMAAADLVALPYTDVLNSGSVLLALSFDVPVLVPAHGAMGELAFNLPGWVRTFSGELDVEKLAWALQQPAPEGHAPLADLGWEGLARRTRDFYEQVVHQVRR